MADYFFRVVTITKPDLDDTTLHQEMIYFLAEIPDEFQRCLVGPVKIHNGFVQYVFCSAGAKLGGRLDNEHLAICEDLLQRYGRDAVMVGWSEDGAEPRARWGGTPRTLPRSIT